jgi:hypothetical protein
MVLAVNIEWEIGDVLVIDVRCHFLYDFEMVLITTLILQNFAIQHSRLPRTGNRKILASFWNQPGMKALPLSTSRLRKDLGMMWETL